jgi:hypothetical protein
MQEYKQWGRSCQYQKREYQKKGKRKSGGINRMDRSILSKTKKKALPKQ